MADSVERPRVLSTAIELIAALSEGDFAGEVVTAGG
jgi:hypothetical protein